MPQTSEKPESLEKNPPSQASQTGLARTLLFLIAAWKWVKIPRDVADEETIVRYCSPKSVKGGKVRKAAFVATHWPLEISVDRAAHSDYAARATAEGRGCAFLIVGVVHSRIPKARVHAAPELHNEGHAEIRLRLDNEHASRVAEKTLLSAAAFSEHGALCEQLAALATTAPSKGP
ncbi:MAG: hypothetical protein ABI421_22480 [Polyangiaceae bacterium]